VEYKHAIWPSHHFLELFLSKPNSELDCFVVERVQNEIPGFGIDDNAYVPRVCGGNPYWV